NLRVDFRLQPGSFESGGESLDAVGFLAGRLTEAIAVAVGVLHDAWSNDLSGRIYGAADGALGADRLPLAPARVDAVKLQIGVLAFAAVGVPPGDAVLSRDHGGIRAEQRLHLLGDLPGLVRLESDDHVVLWAQVGRVLGRRHFRDLLFAINDQLKAVVLNRFQMRTASDQRNVDAGELQENTDMGADGARSVDTNLHSFLPGGASTRRSFLQLREVQVDLLRVGPIW